MGDQQPWGASPKTFRDQFVEDFNTFLLDQNHVSQCTHTHLSPEDMRFLSDVLRFMGSYANLDRGLRQKLPPHPHPHPHPHLLAPSDNYTMIRFINQKDDPFTGMEKNQVPVLTAPVGDPRDMIKQAHRGFQRRRPPGEYTDVSLTATTQERSNSKVFKTTASHTAAAGFTVESAVGGLPQGGPSSQGDASRTGSSGDAHHRDEGGSRPNRRRLRTDELFTDDQGLPENTPCRASAGSKVSSSSRRERKLHICPECNVNFRFDARLRSHMAVHRKEKLLCPSCGSGFGRESSLKRHQDTPSCEKKKQAKLLDSSHSGPMAGSSRNFDRESTASCHGHGSGVSVENVQQHGIEYHIQQGGDLMSGNHALENPIDRHLQSMNYDHRQYEDVSEYYPSHESGQSYPARNLHRGTSPPVTQPWDLDLGMWVHEGYQRDTRGGAFLPNFENEDD